MLNTEKRNPTGGRSREDDILTRRHVASLQNVQNKMSSDVAAVVGQDKDDENGTEKRVIDPELKEAMERLGKFEYFFLQKFFVYFYKTQVKI